MAYTLPFVSLANSDWSFTAFLIDTGLLTSHHHVLLCLDMGTLLFAFLIIECFLVNTSYPVELFQDNELVFLEAFEPWPSTMLKCRHLLSVALNCCWDQTLPSPLNLNLSKTLYSHHCLPFTLESKNSQSKL